MHDGLIKTLIDVRNVPELKNLIFFVVLNSNGCRCTAEGRVLRVSKCSLVVMRGQRNGNLHVL